MRNLKYYKDRLKEDYEEYENVLGHIDALMSSITDNLLVYAKEFYVGKVIKRGTEIYMVKQILSVERPMMVTCNRFTINVSAMRMASDITETDGYIFETGFPVNSMGEVSSETILIEQSSIFDMDGKHILNNMAVAYIEDGKIKTGVVKKFDAKLGLYQIKTADDTFVDKYGKDLKVMCFTNL